jgi:hypothetical protein
MAELILAKDLPQPSSIVAKLLKIKVLKDQLDLLEEELRAEYKNTNPPKKQQTSSGEISVTESQRLTFNNDLILAIATAKGIDPNVLGDFAFKADEKKVQSAISVGLITNDELVQQQAVKITSYDRFTIKPTEIVVNGLAEQAKSVLLQLASDK